MLIISITTLLLLFPSSSTLTTPPPVAPPPLPPLVNLTALLSNAGPFHTFLSLLNASQIIQSLQTQANDTNQGLTLFSPSDTAFSSLPNPSPLSKLTDSQVRSLLLAHAFPKFYTLSDLVKNVSGQAVPTMAGGGQFSLNVSNSSGVVGIDSGLVQTKISSSVYSTDPVSVYQIDQVLLPKAIFGDLALPPVAPPPSQPHSHPPASGPSDTPPKDSGNGEAGPAPETSKTGNSVSAASYRNRFSTLATCFVLMVSGGMLMVL